MDLVSRAKNICLSPATEWNVIANENTPPGTLIPSYVLPLAGLSALAGFISSSIIGGLIVGRTPILWGIVSLVLTLVFTIIGLFIVSFIINALAPTFGAQKNDQQAFKVAVYSATPAWLAGVAVIVPILGWLIAFLGALYGIYLCYLGLPRLMKCSEDKAIGYTALIVVCVFVLWLIIVSVFAVIGFAGLMGAGMFGGAVGGGSPTTNISSDPDSALGRLEQLSQALENSAKKMETAEKAGDANAQVSAAMEGLGVLLGGGRRVEPISLDEIRTFVPETFMSLPRTRISAETPGIAGLTVSRADATFSDGQRNIELEIVDSGGASGLMGLAAWVNVQQESEDENRIERTRRVGGRVVHEVRSKTGGTHEYGMVVADRFMVTARGRGVEFSQLESAVSSLDLNRLESLKNRGVQ